MYTSLFVYWFRFASLMAGWAAFSAQPEVWYAYPRAPSAWGDIVNDFDSPPKGPIGPIEGPIWGI